MGKGDGELKMENGKWKMGDGKWGIENGKWKMESGRWGMGFWVVGDRGVFCGKPGWRLAGCHGSLVI
jgi:hypothetical protein